MPDEKPALAAVSSDSGGFIVRDAQGTRELKHIGRVVGRCKANGARLRVSPRAGVIGLIVHAFHAGVPVDLFPRYPESVSDACLLQLLWQPPIYNPAGSRRELTPALAAGYELLMQPYSRWDAFVRERHPAWPAFSFTKHDAAGFDLLYAMVDPWWYIDTSRPDRWSRAFAFFGLRPQNVIGAYHGVSPVTQADRRLRLLSGVVLGCPGVVTEKTPTAQLQQLRMHVKFLLAYWRHVVSPQHPEMKVFDITKYFRELTTIAAWQRYIKAVNSGKFELARAVVHSV